jgi:integrase
METFLDFAQTILEQRAQDGIRGITRERSRFRVHIAKAAFASMPLDQIEPKHVADWLREMSVKQPADQRGERVLSRATIHRSQALVSVVFAEAVQRGLIKTSPASGVKLKRRAGMESTKTAWAFFTPEEQKALATCEAIPVADRLAIRFAIGTGLRQGEQFALRLEDLRTEADPPHVYVKFGSPNAPPKSGKARTVPLFGDGLAAAREWLEMLPDYAPSNPHKIVFPTSTGKFRPQGKPLGRSSVWHKHLSAAGVKRARWHDCRHTCASSLVAGWWGRAWTLIEVRDMLGHSSVTITERYGHLSETVLQKAARETTTDEPSVTRVSVWWRVYRALRGVA